MRFIDFDGEVHGVLFPIQYLQSPGVTAVLQRTT